IAAALAALGVVWWHDHRVSTTPIAEDSTHATVQVATNAVQSNAAASNIITNASNSVAMKANNSTGVGVQTATVAREPVRERIPKNGSGQRNTKLGNHDLNAAGKIEPSPNRARMYFKTGVRLDKIGRTEDALFMYTLAYYESGKNADANIF